MTDREALPIPDYDHLPAGSLTHRIRSLDADGLAALLDYERAHGDRLPVVQLLSQRLDALRSGEAEPSGGNPFAPQPEHAPAADSGSPGNPATSPDNNQPLRHGVAGQTPNRNVRAR
jgi:hypothetical protein